jgi:energy-coupling factor transporter ATP-binding protein EcfA2
MMSGRARPESCRIFMMIVGATGSGKTRLLRSLAGCAASLRCRPRWPSGRSILDGLGADGAARSGAVGLRWPMADGGAADGGAAAVRRCGERRCGDGDGGAATAVRRRRCGAKLYSRGHRSHRSRSRVGPFHGAGCSVLVRFSCCSGRVRVWRHRELPDGKRKSSPYATPKPVTRNGYGFDFYDHARFIRKVATSLLGHEPISTPAHKLPTTVARINHHQFARLDHVDKSTALPLRTTTPACHCTAAGASGCRCR